MQTSNFAIAWGHRNAVAICRFLPRGWKGRRYEPLAPPAYALKIRSRESFEAIYRDQLDRLDAKKVYADLAPEAVLLCYEKPGEYCHRRLAAAWLEEKLGIQVPELTNDEGRWVRKIPRTLSLFQL